MVPIPALLLCMVAAFILGLLAGTILGSTYT